MTTGVPRLQLDSLGSRATPRGGGSRQQTLQRVFKGLDDDDDDEHQARAAAASASGLSASMITPRASQQEIERRRRVMFDSDDEDTPTQKSRVQATPTQREAPLARATPAAAAPVPEAAAAAANEAAEVNEAKPPPVPTPTATSASVLYRAPSPRIGSWRQQSPGRGGRVPRAEMQRRQARSARDESDSDLDDIAARAARDAMPSTSPLSLAPAANGVKKKTYSRHGAASPRGSPPPSRPPAMPSLGGDPSGMQVLTELVGSMQKELAELREQLQQRPTVEQFQDLKIEVRNLRADMERMEVHLNGSAPSTDPAVKQSTRTHSLVDSSTVTVSAEVVPFSSMNPQATSVKEAPQPLTTDPDSANQSKAQSNKSSVVDSPVLKTPAPKAIRINKTVVVRRLPIPGAQASQPDKVGIGISFGMTQKGDVFITGMAPNGPAKACGKYSSIIPLPSVLASCA